MTLNQLSPNTTGVIEAIHAGQDLRRRLCGLGLRLGIRVRVIRHSPLNGPMQIRVGHTDLILRRTEAANIEVTPA
ncbi:MAG: ferrous iron transport protein A [Thiobacillus sp.]|nr:ferrous iron transport protein A [Thiobacillus sp.]